MIRSIYISNFKIYRERTSFEGLSSLNVLTGVNGRGKSTLMQSLLLPAQSLLISSWANKIPLDGKYVKLGNMGDVKNEKAARSESIVFEYEIDSEHLRLVCDADSDQAQELNVVEVELGGRTYLIDNSFPLHGFVPVIQGEDIHLSPEVMSSIRFVAAERVGPKLHYMPAGDLDVMDSLGEFAPSILYAHKDEAIAETALDGMVDLFPGRGREDGDDNTVAGLLNRWLDLIFDGLSASVAYVASANVYVLNFKKKGNIKEMKPTNVGFGFSYIFPILVAGLTAKKGSVVLIENPEAHLHPRAQSMLGRFLAWVSKYLGVQFFLETHSEHIVNSIRVLTAQSVIRSSDVNILFFDEALKGGVEKIQMDDSGHIESWPENFFDQEEKDLDILL